MTNKIPVACVMQIGLCKLCNNNSATETTLKNLKSNLPTVTTT